MGADSLEIGAIKIETNFDMQTSELNNIQLHDNVKKLKNIFSHLGKPLHFKDQ